MTDEALELAAVKKVMEDRGWSLDGSPPLPEMVGLMIDLLENLMRSQSELRVKVHDLESKARSYPVPQLVGSDWWGPC